MVNITLSGKLKQLTFVEHLYVELCFWLVSFYHAAICWCVQLELVSSVSLGCVEVSRLVVLYVGVIWE